MQQENKQQNPLIERLLFPLIAAGLSVSMLVEQFTGSYRDESKYYVLAIAIPVLVLALIDIIKNIRATKPKSSSRTQTQSVPLMDRVYVRPLIAGAVALTGIYFMEDLGFPIVFSILITVIMRLTGEKSPYIVGGVIVASLLVIHFGFVQIIGLDLPYGLLEFE